MTAATVFYDWSGGMESSAMLVIDLERIRETGAIVRGVDTGKQFPERAASKAQIESILGIEIVEVPLRITFDEFLFERGGMIRKGTTDCSRRMKRGNLARHLKDFPKPWEINIGYNADEETRASEWIDLNERPWCHWRFPLQEAAPPVSRWMTWRICEDAGFTVLLDVYRRMGRFDCFMCGNQSQAQALKVVDNYPNLAAKWMEMEERKGHSFMPVPLAVLIQERARQGVLFDAAACGCFGGTERFPFEESE